MSYGRTTEPTPMVPLTMLQWVTVCRASGNLQALLDLGIISPDSPMAATAHKLRTLVENPPLPTQART